MRSLVFSSLCAAFISVPVILSLPLQPSYVPSSARRDLLGILGDIDGGVPSPATTEPANTSAEGSPSFSLLAFSKAGITVSGASYPTSQTVTTTSSSPPRSTNSLGITITAHPPGSNEPTAVDSSSSVTSKATPTTSVSPYIGDISDASATPPAELTEWKVIGIAVITITFIGTAILAVSFFDSWWGFVRAAVCGQPRRGTRGLAGETLVPDWEKRSWEFKLANEDGHRYPTFASLDSIAREKERSEGLAREGPAYSSSPVAPEMAYGGI